LQQADLNGANAALAEAQARLERLEAAQQRPEEIAVLEAQESRAKAAIEQSQPELERAQELLKRGFAPHSRVEQAIAALERDKASLAEIERQISVGKLKSRSEDIAAAKTVVEQARSRLASAETRRHQRSVRAPADGTVQEIFYRQGEVVPTGRPVLSLLPPGNMKVRFFVPQSQFPNLKAGSQIAVSCDGCANGMKATVFFLSTQAEFTPPVIFSREERQKLVFRIEARPLQPELLHVGQPVSVRPLPSAIAQDREMGRDGGG
jgi:HlyD family secretion protein